MDEANLSLALEDLFLVDRPTNVVVHSARLAKAAREHDVSARSQKPVRQSGEIRINHMTKSQTVGVRVCVCVKINRGSQLGRFPFGFPFRHFHWVNFTRLAGDGGPAWLCAHHFRLQLTSGENVAKAEVEMLTRELPKWFVVLFSR